MTTHAAARMSNKDLLDATARAARGERRAAAGLLALLAEVDARRLYLSEGCSSLFTYCTRVLRLSEHAAYHRIEAARAARRFPVIFDHVADGLVTLTTVAMLRRHMTPSNHLALLEAARHKTKREVEHQIACIMPRPAATAMIRRLSTPRPTSVIQSMAGSAVATGADASTTSESSATALDHSPDQGAEIPGAPGPGPRSKVDVLAADRYLLRVTLSAEGHARLRRAQNLMRHVIPNGDPAAIVDRALSLLVEHLERTKLSKTRRAAASKRRGQSSERRAGANKATRHIPASVRRAVWKRDRGRCAFVGPHGRCGERGFLEYHHLVPHARGGAADPANIALRCRAHNQYEGELAFGHRHQRKQSLGPDRVDGGVRPPPPG